MQIKCKYWCHSTIRHKYIMTTCNSSHQNLDIFHLFNNWIQNTATKDEIEKKNTTYTLSKTVDIYIVSTLFASQLQVSLTELLLVKKKKLSTLDKHKKIQLHW